MSIHADMSFHAEIPLIALLGLVHLGVAFLAGVLGRGGRGNDRGIHYRAVQGDVSKEADSVTGGARVSF